MSLIHEPASEVLHIPEPSRVSRTRPAPTAGEAATATKEALEEAAAAETFLSFLNTLKP